MLTGRWLLFFGFIWILINILVGNFSNSGLGSHNVKTLGFVVTSTELGSLAVVGDLTDLPTLEEGLGEVEQRNLSVDFFMKAWDVAQDIKQWGSLDYPGVLDGPVWAVIRQVWFVFGTLLFVQILWTAVSFLKFA